ncbi:Dabb family protein [Rhodococcus sp. NPDC127530]|uniref:Dabb family protein n=1 Tax=unclassified Rhodococcus (in: high G+C Gram-positive bacteria) TaxID=192944 RepID=UPI0036263405
MAIGHVVTFTFTPTASTETVTAIGEALDALSAASTGVESYLHGCDLQVRPGNADYAVSAVFRDRDALAAYMSSPEHQRIITELIHPHLQSKSSVQFLVPSR